MKTVAFLSRSHAINLARIGGIPLNFFRHIDNRHPHSLQHRRFLISLYVNKNNVLRQNSKPLFFQY